MAATVKATPQDLPPKGGYAPFVTERSKLRTLFSGRTAILAYFAFSGIGYYIYYRGYRTIKKHEIEMRSAKMALYPLLLAETDREYLKQLNRNRRDEAELMKDVPNWEVGTYFGQPIYKTVPKEKFVEPSLEEFYGQTEFDKYLKRTEIGLWC